MSSRGFPHIFVIRNAAAFRWIEPGNFPLVKSVGLPKGLRALEYPS
jgi:hypothetical protein